VRLRALCCEQPRDAPRDDGGLAGARARDDEQRPFLVEDRLSLGGGQIIE